jgi:hypothetical protein
MEENFNITNIFARVPGNKRELVLYLFKEASREICERLPRPNCQVIYEDIPQAIQCDYFPQQLIRHFYVDGKEVSIEEYESFAKLAADVHEERQKLLEEAMLETLRDMRVVSGFTKDEKMAHLDYIIENLKDGPKSSYELQKTISDSPKVYGSLVYSFLDDLEAAGIVTMRYESESKRIMCRLTSFWKSMYSAMKK